VILSTVKRSFVHRQAERKARKAFAGAVAGDIDRFNAALEEIESAKHASQIRELGVRIASATLLSIHHEELASGPQVRRLSREFAEQEAWSSIDAKTALTYLTALNEARPPVSVLPVEVVTPATFVIGAWLLAAFIPDEVEWTDFLDGILNRID
jgi:hypothetical protein